VGEQNASLWITAPADPGWLNLPEDVVWREREFLEPL
jgi:hypothetical protein